MAGTMAQMRSTMASTLRTVVLIVALVALGWSVANYYSYIFADTVDGIIIGNERVTQPSAILLGRTGTGKNAEDNAAQLYSFAIAIKDEKGEIYTASSEDRQWAVAAKGMCAQTKFFPYPPWVLDKSGTYFGARLVRLHDCPENLKALMPPSSDQ